MADFLFVCEKNVAGRLPATYFFILFLEKST